MSLLSIRAYRLSLAVLALAGITGGSWNAIAQGTGKNPVPIDPIYNPHTKSYFELRTDLPYPSRWPDAVKHARSKVFKGTRGRLAVVRDLKTHSFLKANFHLNRQAWIGMRFFCGVRKLVWVDGQEHSRRAFKVWARNWHRTRINCKTTRIAYMPMYYTESDYGFRWQASGPKKSFISYFVEYQTGSENPEAEKAKPKPAAPEQPAAKK